jgi:hypothetical protein
MAAARSCECTHDRMELTGPLICSLLMTAHRMSSPRANAVASAARMIYCPYNEHPAPRKVIAHLNYPNLRRPPYLQAPPPTSLPESICGPCKSRSHLSSGSDPKRKPRCLSLRRISLRSAPAKEVVQRSALGREQQRNRTARATARSLLTRMATLPSERRSRSADTQRITCTAPRRWEGKEMTRP